MEVSGELLETNQKDAKWKTEITKKLNTDLDGNVTQAVEAKEDDIDKEVSELTSCSSSVQKFSQVEVRHNTPFCYTTQNLTDKPDDLPKDPATNSDRSDSLTKSIEDDADEIYSSMDDTFVRTMNRYRYISLCETQHPNIPIDPAKKQKTQRSMSCPEIKIVADRSAIKDENAHDDNAAKPETEVVTSCNSTVTSSCTFVPLKNAVDSNLNSNIRDAAYEQLIPMALDPLPIPREIFGLTNAQVPSANAPPSPMPRPVLFNTLSPPELLDRYLQMGSDTYLSQLNSIPITSTKNTDWTHFGGQPPADEIAILRSQILLLHNQLLFERHRKEIHSERNRRILGRAKTSRMQEEQAVALKYQVTLLEKEIHDLKNDLVQKLKLCNQLRSEKQQSEADLNAQIYKKIQENEHLHFSNKKLQGLLVSQKQENDDIRAECKKCQSYLVDSRVELELLSQEVARCKKLEKNSIWMSKQLVLLQELNIHYKDKIELLKEPPLPEIGLELMKDAVGAEMKDLKQKLETKTCLFDASKSKISELELLLSNMKSKLKEQAQVIENMKSLHMDEISAREDRLTDLLKMSSQKEGHILELYHIQENFQEKIKCLEKQLKKVMNSIESSQSSEHSINFSSSSTHHVEGPVAVGTEATEATHVLDHE